MAGSISFWRRLSDPGSGHDPSTGMVLTLMMAATAIAFVGWGLAHYLYSLSPGTPSAGQTRFRLCIESC